MINEKWLMTYLLFAKYLYNSHFVKWIYNSLMLLKWDVYSKRN